MQRGVGPKRMGEADVGWSLARWKARYAFEGCFTCAVRATLRCKTYGDAGRCPKRSGVGYTGGRAV